MRTRILLTLVALGFASCAKPAPPPPSPLTVFAAASLTDVLGELGRDFEARTGQPVRFSFGGSDTLANQILAGAAADLYASASASWMKKIADAGAIDGKAMTIAGNRLVVVVPAGKPRPADPAGLAAADYRLIAVAHESVPAGAYAREALGRLGLAETLGPRLVGQKDVRAVLRAVAAGEADAGFVYRTDARVEPKVEVAFEIDPALHAAIVYPAAVLLSAPNLEAARQFLEFLRGTDARATLARHGFEPPP